jgi:hypothetical protein
MKHLMVLALLVGGMVAVATWENGTRIAEAAACPTPGPACWACASSYSVTTGGCVTCGAYAAGTPAGTYYTWTRNHYNNCMWDGGSTGLCGGCHFANLLCGGGKWRFDFGPLYAPGGCYYTMTNTNGCPAGTYSLSYTGSPCSGCPSTLTVQ